MPTYDLPCHTHQPPHTGRSRATRSGLASVVARALRRPGLARELTLILAIKIVVLLVFKYTLFGHPQAPHMELPPAQVAQALLCVPASLSPASGNHHDK